jgi:AcrR family transcriptional regulator
MSASARPLRVDAARNRELLLAAAEAEFAERGLSASVADIARRAGIAKGTVFRHFASKEELIAAIVCGHLVTLVTTAQGLADADDAGAALLEFLGVAADDRRQNDVDFLLKAAESHDAVAGLRDDLLAALEVLVERAHAAGALRADVTTADVFLLMCAPVHVVENLADPAPDLWRRYLAIIFDGLRPQGANPLPQSPPTL